MSFNVSQFTLDCIASGCLNSLSIVLYQGVSIHSRLYCIKLSKLTLDCIASRCLNSLSIVLYRGVSIHSQLFTPKLLQANIKEILKTLHHSPLCWETTSHKWVFCTKGQKSGKCFHVIMWYFAASVGWASVLSSMYYGRLMTLMAWWGHKLDWMDVLRLTFTCSCDFD